MPDEKIKTSVRLSVSTIEAVRQLGYTSTTEAINDGLALLISRATSTTIEDKGSTKEDSSLENENTLLREYNETLKKELEKACLLYTSPSPRDRTRSRMPSSA